MTTMNVNIINTALGQFAGTGGWLATLGVASICGVNADNSAASLLMVRLGGAQFYWWGIDCRCRRCLQGIAIIIDHFVLFCAASMALGIAHGCASFYRYAATDCAPRKTGQKRYHMFWQAG